MDFLRWELFYPVTVVMLRDNPFRGKNSTDLVGERFLLSSGVLLANPIAVSSRSMKGEGFCNLIENCVIEVNLHGMSGQLFETKAIEYN